jgi:DNA-binding CsgD family transcriptional regulator
MVSGAETNETPEAVAAALKAGSAQIVRGIQQFREFAKVADKALADPSLTKADKAKYNLLREQALFLVGDCWRRMTKPEAKLNMFRENAAKSYEDYLSAYPEGRYSTNAYVRLGTIYTALGDTEKSRNALDRLSKAFPDSLEAKNAKPQLAKSLIEMGMKKEGTEIYAEMLRTDGAYTAWQFVNAGEALIEAIKNAYDGDTILPAKIAKHIATAAKNISADREVRLSRAFSLSDREVDVALMMYEGFTNRQISAALKLSEGTTRNYVSSVYVKTNTQNRAEAIRVIKETLN